MNGFNPNYIDPRFALVMIIVGLIVVGILKIKEGK